MLKKVVIVIVAILIVIQFIPVERSNPPVTQDINSPENISSILRTSCYDCHSNETNWRWYSYVAPVSFLIASDVQKGRKRINFSEWDKYDEKKKLKKLDGIREMVEEGEMPLPMYTFIHTDAKLSTEKIRLIKDWVKSVKIDEKPLRYQKESEKE